MERYLLKERAKINLKNNKIFMLLFLLPIMASLLSAVAGSLLMVIATMVIAVVIEYFLLKCINYTKDVNPKLNVGEVMEGMTFDNFFTFLKAEILVVFFVMLWTCLLIVPGIIKAYEYSMVPYLIVDDETLTVKEAFRKSKIMMKGEKFNLFVLSLSFILWIIGASLTFGLLYIWVTPYMALTFYEFFLERKSELKLNPIAADVVF